MKNKMNKSIGVMFLVFIFFLPSRGTTKQDHSVYYNQGNEYLDKGQYDQAIYSFSKAIKINPRYAEAYASRGYAYYFKGQDDQAVSDFNKAIKINKKFAGSYTGRGLVYLAKGQYERALSNFNKAIEINPMYAFAYYNRGLVYYNKKNYDISWIDINWAHYLGFEVQQAIFDKVRNTSRIQKRLEETAKKTKFGSLMTMMCVDQFMAYDFGYKMGICDPDKAAGRFYNNLQAFQPMCVIGAQDKQKGIPYDWKRVLKIIDFAIASANKKGKSK